jgi:hypothetical protein
MATKVDCWEFKKCSREPGGAKVAELGVCPAARSDSSGINGGTRGGRICWAVAGTLSSSTRLTVLQLASEQGFCAGGAQPPCQGLRGGKTQGTFATKAANCMNFDFYVEVKREEGATFKLLPAN